MIVKIMGLALKVNRETKHTVFFDFHGHVNSVVVQIYFNGWKSGKEKDYLRCFYLDDMLSPDRFEKCGEIIAKLVELLGDKK